MQESRTLPSNRIAYMDLLRCGAVYLVVLLHCISATLGNPALVGTRLWWVCDILNSAARMGVPLFFMLSGALLLSDQRTLDPLPFYRKRLQRILLPFLCWDIIYYLEGVYLSAQTPDVAQFFVELLTEKGSKYHLWFIYKLISIYLLLPFLKRILDHCRTRDGVVLLGAILLQPSVIPLINLLPGIEIDLFGTLIDGRVGFFVLGWLLSRQELSRRGKSLLYAGGALAFLLNIFGNYWLSSPGQLNLWFNDGCALTHYLTAGSVFVWVKDRGNISAALAAGSRRISSLAFGIYLSHALFLDLWTGLLQQTQIHPAGILALSFAATAVSSTAASWLLAKSKLMQRLLVG